MKRILLFLLIVSTLHPIFGQTFGNSIAFDGIDDFMIVPHHESLNPGTDSWTIVLWLKAPNIEQDGPLVRKRLAGEGYNQYNLLIGHTDPHNPSPGKGLIYNYIDDARVSERSGHLQDEFVDGNWHHIAVVADKIADSVFVFIDGIKQVFDMQYNFGEWPDVSNLDSLGIGRDTGGSDLYTGEMDELSIWSKALNMSQVQQMMYDTISSEYYATADSGVVAYYRFDEFEDLGTGNAGSNDFRDLSFYGNHADSEGLPTLTPSGIFVGIEEEIELLEFNIFPNPASSVVSLQSTVFSQQSVVVEIYDLKGRKLLEKHIPAGTEEIEVDISHLPSGVYGYKVSTENKSVTKKLIIK